MPELRRNSGIERLPGSSLLDYELTDITAARLFSRVRSILVRLLTLNSSGVRPVSVESNFAPAASKP